MEAFHRSCWTLILIKPLMRYGKKPNNGNTIITTNDHTNRWVTKHPSNVQLNRNSLLLSGPVFGEADSLYRLLFSYFEFISGLSILFDHALAKNSSFGFSALAFVSAKTKCAVCAVGFSCMPHNVHGYA